MSSGFEKGALRGGEVNFIEVKDTHLPVTTNTSTP